MNQTQLASRIADDTGLTRSQVERVLSGLDRALIEAARTQTEVKLGGLFTFDVVDRPAREGRNPQTGEPMTIAANTQARLRPGNRLKAAAKRVS